MSAPRVLVADTGMGNLRSVARALERAGAEVSVTADPEALARAPRLVVPGQGGFGECALALRGGLGEAVREHVASGRPYLGICLGMQILFESSAEAPGAPGLGLFPGTVERLAAAPDPDDPARRLKIPHMGWNEVVGRHPLLPAREWFYFVHSFCCVPSDAAIVVGEAEYGQPVCAAVARENVFACQFHPEKSQRAGARLLEGFLGAAWS